MSDSNSLKNGHVAEDLTNESLMFIEEWDCRLTRLAIYGIGLEELIALYEEKAARLRDMLDTGEVRIAGDFPEWSECPAPTEPIVLYTHDPRVAARFQLSEVIWSARDEAFEVLWGENGAATFESADEERIPVQLWQEESELDEAAE